MSQVLEEAAWTTICAWDDILPEAGVCALVDGAQVAVFRVAGELYAIDNVDPFSGAAVLSRGLAGNLVERIVVASPMHKQHFDRRTGECLESPRHAVRTWPVRRQGDRVQVGRGGA